MLLGYNSNTGYIEFLFTDSDYLEKQFPKNSAKISNFWKFEHGLKEFFIDAKEFPEFQNYRNYKIIDNKIIPKTQEELNINPVIKPAMKVNNFKMGMTDLTEIEALEAQLKAIQAQLEILKNKG